MVVSNHYETLLVLQSTLSEETRNGLVDKIKAIIEKDGKIEKIDLWGNRRLAYPIDYKTEGYYVVIQFISHPDLPKELDRVYRITDGILRSIIIKRDERYLDVQVKLDSKAAVKAEPKEKEVAAEEGPTAEEPAVEEVVEVPVVTEEPAAEEVAEEKPARKPRAKKVVEEEPATEVVEEAPAAEAEEEPKPKTRKPRAKKVVEEEPTAEEPVATEEPAEPITEEVKEEGEKDAE